MTMNELLAAISTSLGIITIIGRWLIVAPLKNFISEQTRQIQPNANGGRSLNDVAQKMARLEALIEPIIGKLDRVEERLDTHIAQHVNGGSNG